VSFDLINEAIDPVDMSVEEADNHADEESSNDSAFADTSDRGEKEETADKAGNNERRIDKGLYDAEFPTEGFDEGEIHAFACEEHRISLDLKENAEANAKTAQ
jgi:hypothetical protein